MEPDNYGSIRIGMEPEVNDDGDDDFFTGWMPF